MSTEIVKDPMDRPINPDTPEPVKGVVVIPEELRRAPSQEVLKWVIQQARPEIMDTWDRWSEFSIATDLSITSIGGRHEIPFIGMQIKADNVQKTVQRRWTSNSTRPLTRGVKRTKNWTIDLDAVRDRLAEVASAHRERTLLVNERNAQANTAHERLADLRRDYADVAYIGANYHYDRDENIRVPSDSYRMSVDNLTEAQIREVIVLVAEIKRR